MLTTGWKKTGWGKEIYNFYNQPDIYESEYTWEVLYQCTDLVRVIWRWLVFETKKLTRMSPEGISVSLSLTHRKDTY